MAEMSGLSPEVRDFLKTYQWQRIDPVPWSEVRVPIERARLGLVITACMTNPGDVPFQAEQPENDSSIRIIRSDVEPAALVNTFPGQAFDHAGLEADPNLLIPLDRLHQMVREGEIGEIAPRTVSLCGHITKPRRLMEATAPEIARLFVNDDVDAVMLVPA